MRLTSRAGLGLGVALDARLGDEIAQFRDEFGIGRGTGRIVMHLDSLLDLVWCLMSDLVLDVGLVLDLELGLVLALGMGLVL
jgi:hypothetical protein